MESRKGKLGLGTAYLHGFQWAIRNDYDYIFEMDADFSHDPKDLPRLLHAVKDANFDSQPSGGTGLPIGGLPDAGKNLKPFGRREPTILYLVHIRHVNPRGAGLNVFFPLSNIWHHII